MQHDFLTSAARSASAARGVRLDQIHRRDPLAEGRFWYSVVTTGVYCRPTCPSRRARPHNIRFHETLDDARATGFRPCGRCRPEAPSQSDRHRAIVEAACRMMAASPSAQTAGSMAAAIGLSPSQFYRLFRRVTGTTPSAWARTSAGVSPAAAAAPHHPGSDL